MGAADPGPLNRFGEHPEATLEYGPPIDGWVSWSRHADQEVAEIKITGDHRICPSHWLNIEPGLEAAYDLRHHGQITGLRLSFPLLYRGLTPVLVMRSMLGENISQRILSDLLDPSKHDRLRPMPVTAYYHERRNVRRVWRRQWRRLRWHEMVDYLRQLLPQNAP